MRIVTPAEDDGGVEMRDAISAFAEEVMSESPGVYSGYAYVVELYPADGSAARRFAYAGDPSFFRPGGGGEGRWIAPPPGKIPEGEN